MKNLFYKTKLLFIISFLIMSFVFIPAQVFGENSGTEAESRSIVDNLKTAGGAAQYNTDKSELTDLAGLVGQIIGAFFAVLGIIFLGYIIFAGWMWMIAKGDEQRVTDAKAIMRNAVIGIIILVGAYAITFFVLTALEGFSSNL